MSEGAPGLVHGGAILTALDVALGAATWVAGLPSLTVRLETEFRKAVPLDAKLLAVTRVGVLRSRMALVEGELLGADGTVFASAKGRFMRLDAASQRRIFGRSVEPTPAPRPRSSPL
jgi:acyl-coenzyme A thioesterase PaaI-like protein